MGNEGDLLLFVGENDVVMYTGKDVCQGCGEPGTNINRNSRNSLCVNCLPVFLAGKSQVVVQEGYIVVWQHYHAFRADETNRLLHNILQSVHNPYAVITNHSRYCFKESFGSAGKNYRIPERLFAPLKEFVFKLDELLVQLRDIPKLTAAAMDEERTKIYNEGIERGRNLLLQLECGGLSMDDFTRQIPYHKH